MQHFIGALIGIIGFFVIGNILSWGVATGILLMLLGNNLYQRSE